MQDVLRFWLERGVAGYRVDAIDRLLKDAQLRDDPPAVEPFGLPLAPEEAKLSLAHSRNAPDTGRGAREDPRRGRRRTSWSARCTCPQRRWQPYLGRLRRRVRLRAAARGLGRRDAARGDRRDHAPAGRRLGALEPRLRPARHPLRRRERARRGDAPAHAAGHRPSSTRATRSARPTGPAASAATTAPGRDRFRHPMQWDGSRGGGFTSGEPWLPLGRPRARERRGAARRSRLDAHARARADPAAALAAARLPSCSTRAAGVVAYARGEHVVAVNTTAERAARAARRRAAAGDRARRAARRTSWSPHAGAVSRN